VRRRRGKHREGWSPHCAHELLSKGDDHGAPPATRPETAGHPISTRPPLTIRSIRRASVIAGASLLLMAALAGFGYIVAVEGLVTYDDATRNATNILESLGLFRSGIVSLFVVIALDLVVAWGLYRVFTPVSRTLSAVGAWMRIVYGGVFAVAVAQLVEVLRLLDTGGVATEGTDPRYAEALAGVNRFADIYDAGLILFGVHLLVIGWLAFEAGYVPTWLGVLLAVSGVGYVVDGVGALLSAGPWTDVSTFTFIGEFLLAVWLVIRGRRMEDEQCALITHGRTGDTSGALPATTRTSSMLVCWSPAYPVPALATASTRCAGRWRTVRAAVARITGAAQPASRARRSDAFA